MKPIIVGSSEAVFEKRSFRRVGFDGSPLMFWRNMRSRESCLGIIGVGPHVMLCIVRVLFCVAGVICSVVWLLLSVYVGNVVVSLVVVCVVWAGVGVGLACVLGVVLLLFVVVIVV